ncbi:MAG: HAD-IA family hydrolase [Actinomycetota bacterium]
MQNRRLKAVIFDVDGTLGETERHGHRVAFNRAFEQLGMDDRWDEEMYGKLLRVTGGERRLKHYFVDYAGRPAKEAAELAAKLHPVKTDLFLRVVEEGKVPPRPGVLRFIRDLAEDGLRLAVATTGTAAWVDPLLRKLCALGGLKPFEVLVTGDQVVERKPDPEAFNLALERLDLGAGDVVIVEDSKNGVQAAKAAGCVCLAVQGEYADPAELQRAELVVDDFGEPGSRIEVLHNPLGVEVGEMLTHQVVHRLHSAAG